MHIANLAVAVPRSATILAITMLMAACAPQEPAAVANPVRPAYVALARSSSDAALTYVGEVRAARRAELSFPVSGRVANVLAEVGDNVRQGQIVASLDERPLQAQLAASQAEEQRAQAMAIEARQRLERLRPARQAQAASPAEWGSAELELATAEAALQSARAQREQASWSLENARLRSPIDGVIALRNIERGQAVGPGAAALAIDGTGRELSIHVPGNQRLVIGQPVTLQGQDGTHTSRVLRVAGRLDAGGVRQAWLAVPDAAAVGSTWSVAVQGQQDTTSAVGVQVPLRAIRASETPGTGSALRLGADGQTLEATTVTLGAVQGEWVEVHKGLAAGDRVVVAGAQVLQPGTKIQPVMVQR